MCHFQGSPLLLIKDTSLFWFWINTLEDGIIGLIAELSYYSASHITKWCTCKEETTVFFSYTGVGLSHRSGYWKDNKQKRLAALLWHMTSGLADFMLIRFHIKKKILLWLMVMLWVLLKCIHKSVWVWNFNKKNQRLLNLMQLMLRKDKGVLFYWMCEKFPFFNAAIRILSC